MGTVLGALWSGLGTLGILLLAVAWATVAGAHHGRRSERRRLQSPRSPGTAASVRISPQEAHLRARLGLRQPHPNPEAAAQLRQAKFRKTTPS